MRNFILFLAILCGGASFIFFTAAKTADDGPSLSNDLCASAKMLCHNPEQLAYGAVGLAGLWLLLMFVAAIRG